MKQERDKKNTKQGSKQGPRGMGLEHSLLVGLRTALSRRCEYPFLVALCVRHAVQGHRLLFLRVFAFVEFA